MACAAAAAQAHAAEPEHRRPAPLSTLRQLLPNIYVKSSVRLHPFAPVQNSSAGSDSSAWLPGVFARGAYLLSKTTAASEEGCASACVAQAGCTTWTFCPTNNSSGCGRGASVAHCHRRERLLPLNGPHCVRMHAARESCATHILTHCFCAAAWPTISLTSKRVTRQWPQLPPDPASYPLSPQMALRPLSA